EDNAIPFTDVTVEAISQSLRSQEYQSRGFEQLKHIVDDKIYY
ncbi:4436_t:CDS:2, partial [Funneliformis caledonium]